MSDPYAIPDAECVAETDAAIRVRGGQSTKCADPPPKHGLCMLCKKNPATGYENGWRLKVCEPCADSHTMGDGLPLDYSPFGEEG